MPTSKRYPASWSAIKALFEQALDLPAGEREAFVAGVVLDDEGMRDELRSLLAHHEASGNTGGFLGQAAGQAMRGAAGAAGDGAAREGQRLGAWEIVRPLGAGGMGEVFEARRADGQYQGRAAIKLLKRGMDSAAVLQRFAQERQALARLQHPHIASLLDAGLSSDGLPFFVMAFVDGRSIDVAARELSLEQRLALFLQLCDAVAYAHRNLLVHRDLKPGNVLVTPEGQVMLLDFGIAKALDPSADPDSDATLGAARPFTPNYASPEQVRGEPVSTATDIYSLGVLLYQMLTGVRPTGRTAGSAAEAARSVLEETPTRPSGLAAAEGLDPQWLSTRKRLVGDLDNILLKALEKPIARRYASVDALAQDLRLYLGGYPVSARAPSAGYVLGKLIARNRSGAALAGLALLAVLGGLGGTSWQAHRAEQALAVAEGRLKDIRKLSREVLVRYGDAVTHLPGGMKIKEELLTDTLGYLDRLLAEAGPDELDFKGEIAMAYARLADIQVANNLNALDRAASGSSNAQRALALFTAAEPAQPQDPMFYMWWGRAQKAVAHGLRAGGDIDAALAQLATAAAMLERGLLRFPANPHLRSELGSMHFLTGQMQDTIVLANKGSKEAALASLAKASTIYLALVKEDRTPDADSPANVFQLGTIEGARALIYFKRNDFERAREFGRSSVAYQEQALAMQDGNLSLRGGLVNSAFNLAAFCLELGDGAGALQASSRAWQHLDFLQREEPQNANWRGRRLSGSLHHGRALLANGRPVEALQVLQASEAELTRQGPAQLSRLSRSQAAAAVALWELGRGAEAQQKAQTARTQLQALTEKTPQDSGPWLWLGELNTAQAAALPGQRSQWLVAARDAYERAAALAPLAGIHLGLSQQSVR